MSRAGSRTAPRGLRRSGIRSAPGRPKRALRRRLHRMPAGRCEAWSASPLLREQDLQIVHVIFRTAPIGHQCTQLPAAVDHISEGGVRNEVAAAFDVLLRDDAVVLAYCGELACSAGAADESRIECVQVLFHARRIVALGIDGYIDDLDVVGGRTELATCLL